MGSKVDLLQGTLEVLILKSVSLGELHGYGILLRIEQIAQGRLEIPQGSFYVALYRMEHKGLISSEWGESENNRRAKFYKLTAGGRKQLKRETEKWAEMTDVVGTVLSAIPETL